MAYYQGIISLTKSCNLTPQTVTLFVPKSPPACYAAELNVMCKNQQWSNIMSRIFSILILSIILTACGGGDSSPTSTNSSGFPDVAGRYSFNTGSVSFSCSDGSTGTNPAIALNFDVTQNANVITLANTNASGNIPGITIIDSTDSAGNVQENSSFIVTQIATANIDGISGTVNINYNVTGSFTSSGWSGTYTYTASSASFGSCRFTTSFTGSKITTARASLTSNEINESNSYPIDFYDQFGIIGSFIAANK